jgi:uncharacterized membrane protein
VIGRHTGAGALTGALAGALFGPAGLAFGLVGELFAEVRDSVPEGSSALMLLAQRRHVDAMIDALRGTQARLAIRRTLSDDAMAALETVLAEAPRVSPDQSRDESHEMGDDRSHRSV